MSLPGRVRLVEVGLRDGLQNELTFVPTAVKLQLAGLLADAGHTTIELTSFVSPKWVEQMRDASDVLGSLPRVAGVSYPVLVPNLQGLERALAAGAREIAVFVSASEAFSTKNTNCTIAESVKRAGEVTGRALAAGLGVRGYLSCAVACPYQGPIAPQEVASVAGQLFALGCAEVSLGDTIGVATPAQIRLLLEACAKVADLSRFAGHFHDTYGMAIANIYASLTMGLTVFDCSVGGLGGCPYAPGAAGNVASEDLVYLLNGLGIDCGIDLQRLLTAASFILGHLGRSAQSKVGRAHRVETSRQPPGEESGNVG